MKTSKVLLVVVGLLVLSMLAACAAPAAAPTAAPAAQQPAAPAKRRWHRILRAQLYRQRPGVVLSAARRRK